MVLAPYAAALEPTAQVVEFYNPRLNHYFITAFPEEAAMLDAGTTVQGWTRTGVTFNAWRARATIPLAVAGVPLLRHAGRRSGLALLHGGCRRVRDGEGQPQLDLRGDRVPHPRCRRTETVRPTRKPCTAASIPGASVSQSNHRFLPDLTMHQKMAGSSIARGRGHVRPAVDGAEAGRCRAPARAIDVRAHAMRWVAHVAAVGTQAFLDEQFAASGSRYSSNKYVPAIGAANYCPTDPNPYCARDYYSLFQLQNDFFRNALHNDDQLRQRVAFALSQILVTSGLDINLAYGMATYQQIFLDHAFGNFETLMTRSRCRSVMGDYLDMVNNDKPVAGTNPNENYARELLQLFSIGLWEQNLDGTPLLDAYGKPIADLRPGDGRRLRARVHRLDVSACCPDSRRARTTSRTSWAT